MEVVGLSAGLVSLALQLADGTRKLRDAYRLTGSLPSKLDRLADNLDLLQHVAELLSRSKIPSRFRDGIIACSLEDVTKELDRLSKRVAKVESSKKLAAAARRVRLAPSLQDELKHLEDLVHSAESKMLLGLAVFETQQRLPPPDVSSGARAPETQQRINGASSDRYSSHKASIPRPRKPLSGRFHGCAYRKCRCRCHTQGFVGGRFWGVQYTPLSIILSNCDHPTCNVRLYKVSFRIALSQIGLKWAVTAAAGMRSGGGSYSLDVSLRPQHIVRFTSDGFLLLFNILDGRIGLEDGIARFKVLRENDPSVIDHVNPAGRGYIEELLMRPSYLFEHQDALLRFFIKDLGMEKGLDNVSFLYSCMNWIGEGPHIALFDTLFKLGYDPSMVESPRPELWPKPSDPNWISEELTPDPFFIEIMSEFVELDTGFGGTSDLQYKILRYPVHAFRILANPMYALDQSPNFLGQTPLHLAVVQSSLVLALLEADHSVDAVDNFGLTPLMYAAGLGKIESAKRLISAGADITIQCGRFQRDFIAYALARGQSEFIVQTILHLQSTYPQQASQLGHFYGARTLLDMTSGAVLPWVPVEYVEKLVQVAGDTNFTFDDPGYEDTPEHAGARGNHLLHYGWPLQHVQVIMKSGFNLLNEKNDIGGTALMSAASHGDPLVTQYFIEMGAEVNEHDIGGMDALAYCLWGWGKRGDLPFGYQDKTSYPEVARTLLDAGANPYSTDDCDCACSTSGCTVTHTLPAVFRTAEGLFTGTDSIWTTLEWLYLLEDRQNEEVLRSSLTSLLRRSLFEELGMSHTCCRRARKWSIISSLLCDRNTAMENERVAIRAQQMQKRDQLELQTQRMANLGIAELMCRWQQSVFQCHLLVSRMDCPSWLNGLKARYEHTLNPATPEIKLGPLERTKPSGIHNVDERSDSITQTIHCSAFEPDKELPFSSSLAYLEKLEQAFYEGGAGDDKGDRNAWYNRRLDWVLRFLEVLQVPQLYIRAGLRWHLTRDCWWLEGKDPSDVMTHFLDSRKAMLAHKM